MRACVLVPIYEHGATIEALLGGLAPLGLPILVVDDGSGPQTARALERAASRHPEVRLIRHERNLGRGAALRTGYRAAERLGCTHALQLDADLQHDPGDAPRFLDAAARDPDALVLGSPIFDASAGRARRYGRWISKLWVWIETGSFAIRDPLCGYRCMPLRPTLEILDAEACGDHMEFDPEIAVRLAWRGVKVVNLPTRVRYFEGGISHFDMLRDNARISRTHARLFFTMLARLCALAVRRERVAG